MTASATLAAIATLAAPALPQEPEQSTIQLPSGLRVTDHLVVDVDADGRTDLVLACRAEAGGSRRLRVHLRRAGRPAFSSKPSTAPIELDRDVVAFCFADVRPTPGRELILLTGEQVVLVGRDQDGAPNYERLARHPLVWPAADPDGVVPLRDSVFDYDGDGDHDLLLPRPDGWSVWLQGGGGFGTPLERPVPPRERRFFGASGGGSGNGPGFALDFERRRASAPLVSVTARTPRCEVLDLDGDGTLDLLSYRNGSCFVGLQRPAGGLEPREFAVPLPEDRLALLDPAFDVQLPDLDADGRADLLLTTTARRGEDLEARVDWFFARPDGTWPERRAGRLRLQPLAAPVRLVDLDGDGRRELVCVSVRTSAMRAVTGDSAAALDGQLTIFRNRDGGFARPVALNRALPLEPSQGGRSEPFLRARAARDGRPGDVVLLADGQLQRRPLSASGDRLRLLAANAAVDLPENARIVTASADAGEFLILTESEVRHVRLP